MVCWFVQDGDAHWRLQSGFQGLILHVHGFLVVWPGKKFSADLPGPSEYPGIRGVVSTICTWPLSVELPENNGGARCPLTASKSLFAPWIFLHI